MPPIGPPEDDTNDGDLGGDDADDDDVDTTGSDPGTGTEPEKPTDWKQNPYVQTIAGAWAGFGIGTVPFGGTAEELAAKGGVLPKGSAPAQRGLAFGIMAGGLFTMIGGVTGEVLGGAASATGIGTAIGVPAIVVSTTLVLGGAANVLAGAQALMAAPKGSGSSTQEARPGKPFRQRDKKQVVEANKQKNDGAAKCENCDIETVPAQKSQKGVTPPKNETQVDHIQPRSKGGSGTPENGQVLCRGCNREKSNNETQ